MALPSASNCGERSNSGSLANGRRPALVGGVTVRKRRRNNGVRKVCRCSIERQRKCSHPFHFNFTPAGQRPIRFSIDEEVGYHVELRSDAEGLADHFRDQIRAGTFIRHGNRGRRAVAVARILTLRGFADRYLEECSLPKAAGKPAPRQKRKHSDDYHRFTTLCAFRLADGRTLGELPFAAVDEALYERFITARREQGYAASTVNKDVQLITSMCRWAARRKLYGERGVSPITGESHILVRKPHHERQRPITDAELETLYQQCQADQRGGDAEGPRRLRAYIELALITCLRLTELYRLLWSDVCGSFVRVRPDATKVETAQRLVPLDARALAWLAFLRRDPAGRLYPENAFVFGSCGEPPVDIHDAFNTLVLRAFPARDEHGRELPRDWVNGKLGPKARQRLAEIDLLFSDFRHEGALRKYRQGWHLNEIQRLLGHRNIKQTSTYLGVGNEDLAQAMATHGSGATRTVEGVPAAVDWPRMQSDAIQTQPPAPARRRSKMVSHVS
jgi:integrase